MTLPANSTFLPILDDLLSPDFRPVLLPAQTPQTPTDIVSFAGGKIITNAFGNITFSRGSGNISRGVNPMSKSVTIDYNGFGNGSRNNQKTACKNTDEAAAKIQNWWKSRSNKKRSNSFDIGAERAKHSLRHNRTEEHIRYLENEVNRLKSALSAERKIRSLQLEAIRSLWSQVQRISTSESTTGSSSLMTRSVPNGLPITNNNNNSKESGPNTMSMSMNAALESTVNIQNNNSQGAGGGDVHTTSCSCSKEVQSLRESLSEEMSQLRAKLDQLTTKDSTTTTTTTIKSSEKVNEVSNTSHNNSQNTCEEGEISTSSNTGESNSDNTEIKQQHKRPFSLNLAGISNNPKSPEEKEQINDYADQMASKLVEDELKK